MLLLLIKSLTSKYYNNTITTLFNLTWRGKMYKINEDKPNTTTWKEKTLAIIKNPIVLGVLFALGATAISAIPFSIPLVTSAFIGALSLMSTACFIYSAIKYIPKIVNYFKNRNIEPAPQNAIKAKQKSKYTTKEPFNDLNKTQSKTITNAVEKGTPILHSLSNYNFIHRNYNLNPSKSKNNLVFSPLRNNIDFNKNTMLEGNKNTIGFDIYR